MRRGAKLSIYIKDYANSPLHWACFYGDFCLARHLLSLKPEGQKLAMQVNK